MPGYVYPPFIERIIFIAWWIGQGAGIVGACWAIALNRRSRRSQRQSEDAERATKTKPQMSPWRWLGWWQRFRKHRAAVVSSAVLAGLYLLAVFCEFVAPYDPGTYSLKLRFAPPQQLHFFDESRVFYPHPFVYGVEYHTDPETFARSYEPDFAAKHLMYLFVRGDPYRMWGLFEMDHHLFGLKDKEARWLILGADDLGRDVFSRMLYGARIPLLIGLLGAIVSLMLGSYIDSTLGYYSFVVGIPYLLFGEVWLTLMGFGTQPPSISWGMMLIQIPRLLSVSIAPWLLLPGMAIALTSALFVLVGQGLREDETLTSRGDR